MADNPGIKIPLGATGLDDFKKAMNETSAVARTATRAVLKEFIDLNTQLAGPIAASLAASYTRAALGVVGKITLIIGAFKLLGDAVTATKGQLDQITDVANRATSTRFSPEFWQSFVSGAHGAEKEIETFQTALENAFQALKPVVNPDWSVWDNGVQKITAVEDAMRGYRELFTTDQNFSGFDLFKNATTQDQQVTAVLIYMKQLQDIGQNVAALDLGDKLFGSRFTDKVRTGELSVDQMLDSIRTKSDSAFSDQITNRAKELNSQLQIAWDTLEKNLHPALETLDNIGLDIKSAWVDIVKLMGEAASLVGKLTPTANTSGVPQILQDQRAQLQNRLSTDVTPIQRTGLQQQLDAINAKIAPYEASQVPEPPINFSYGGSNPIPMPRRRPDDAPKPPPPDTGAQRDRFEASSDTIEKQTAALKARSAVLGDSTAAQDKARVAAQLTTTAMQLNAETGKGQDVVTDEQRKRIDQLANSYEAAALAMQKAQVNSEIKFGQQTAFLTPGDAQIANQLKGIYGNDVPKALNSTEAAALRVNAAFKSIGDGFQSALNGPLVDFETGTKSASAALASFAGAFERTLLQMVNQELIVKPLLSGIGGIFGLSTGTSSALPLPGSGSFIGPVAHANGGLITGPGGPRDDKIPAMLSNNEFVVNAASTAKHRGLLEAINSDSVPRFADGGVVGQPSQIAAQYGGGHQINFGDIHLHGAPQGGNNAQNREYGKQMMKQFRETAGQMIGDELRKQTRPGGMLKR
jgi:hypothetical protein